MNMPDFELPAPHPTLRERAITIVCGRDHDVRVRVQHQMPANIVYGCCAALLLLSMQLSLMPRDRGLLLLTLMVLGQAIFFALLRSGRTLRWRDPGMMLPQNLLSLACIALAYTVMGPIRGTSIILMLLVLIYGMFTLSPREALVLGGVAMAVLGGTMATMATAYPREFAPHEEGLRFWVMLVVLPTVSICVWSVARLRARLVRNKLELREALERAQELATHDMLTGLHNRLHMHTLLDRERSRQERHGGAFSVAIIDLDHFKHVNDEYGHQAGDAVLRHFADAARDVLRNTDIIARWGGEEFLVLFTASSREHALQGLQRLRDHLVRHPWASGRRHRVVRFSAGVAEHNTDESLSQTLERADRALYSAKAGGRDRAVLAPPA